MAKSRLRLNMRFLRHTREWRFSLLFCLQFSAG